MTTKVLQLLNSVVLPALAVSSTVFGVVSGASADMVKIIAKPMCGKDLGHVMIAFYDVNNNVVTKAMWSDGSMWSGGGVKPNTETDKKMAKGEDGGCYGLVTRTAYVTATRREWLQNAVASPGGTDCHSYLVIGSKVSPGKCSCVNFATRVWRQATADWERWQFQGTPTAVANSIFFANGRKRHGDFDGGKIWN